MKHRRLIVALVAVSVISGIGLTRAEYTSIPIRNFVTSVFGRIGDVVAQAADYAAYYLKLPGYTTSVIYLADAPYNVVGDGNTSSAANNNAGIQAAINACATFPAASSAKGCILHFPCGIVDVSTGFTSTFGLTIQACGAGFVQQGGAVSPDIGGTMIRQSCTTCDWFLFTTADPITIRDIGFEGPYTGSFTNTATVGAIISVRPEVSPVSLPQRGLYINNITTKGGFNAIVCQLCGNFSITNNRIYAPKQHGISLTNAALTDSGDDSIIGNTIGNFPGWTASVGDGILLNTHGGTRIISNKILGFANLIHVVTTQAGATGARTGTLIINSNSLEEAQTQHIRVEQGVDTTSSYGNIIITSNEFSNGVFATFQASVAIVAGTPIGAGRYVDFVMIADNLLINSTAFVNALCFFIADGNYVTITNNFCSMQNSTNAFGIGVVTNALHVAVLENTLIGVPGGQYLFSAPATAKLTHTVDGGIPFAALPPNSAAGSQVFVSDSAAGGACNGAGAGAMGFFQGGAWRCP